MASGAYQVLVNPGQLATVALPPANRRQIIRGPLTENDEVASVFHQGPASGAPFGRAAPVAILIEYSSP